MAFTALATTLCSLPQADAVKLGHRLLAGRAFTLPSTVFWPSSLWTVISPPGVSSTVIVKEPSRTPVEGGRAAAEATAGGRSAARKRSKSIDKKFIIDFRDALLLIVSPVP